jgi:hypothetical protein
MVTETKANAKAERVILDALNASPTYEGTETRKPVLTANVSKALKAAGLPASETTTLSHLHRMLADDVLADDLPSHTAWALKGWR